MKDVPYIVHEGVMARMERTVRRLWILCLVLVVLLVGSNALWLYHVSQFEEFETTIEAQQDGEGVNIIGNGDINYGTESSGNN